MSRCTLELSGEVVAVADGGTFEAEYLLFDSNDIELSSTGPGTVRETGYRTTVGEARARLTQLGLTREAAEELTAAARPWIARTYARGAAVRRIVEMLDASELFDGGKYDAESGSYAGVWLDLPALVAVLSTAFDPIRCATLIQALHHAAVLADRRDDEPLALTTAELTAVRRPGERTFKRISVQQASVLVGDLAALKRTGDREGSGIGPGRREVTAWLRERAHRTPGAASRFAAMQEALYAHELPTRGPLADAELWAVETKLSRGETNGVVELLESIEAHRGRLPGTMYLRARAALMAETEEPSVVAERVSALSTSMAEFHELQLLAAQAWDKAGDTRRAQAFARDVLENASASDSLRMLAREILEATGRTPTALIPKRPPPPSGSETHPPPANEPLVVRDNPSQSVSPPAELSNPAFQVEVNPTRAWSNPPEREMDAEVVETLGLPPGAQDQPPPNDEAPRTPAAARLMCTYLARELGRELRMRYGFELRTDVDGLEMTQRFLRERVTSDHPRTNEDQREVLRHGAFLSELLARRLSARWVDLEPVDRSRWAMLVPSRMRGAQTCRVWPFARVLRFVALRHKERDLVSYYLQLEIEAR